MEEARADDIDCASAGRSPTEPGSEGVNPIKSFLEARRQSVSDQLAGSQGAMCWLPLASTRATSPTPTRDTAPSAAASFRRRLTGRTLSSAGI